MIRDIQAGDKIVAFFVLRKKEIRTKRETGEIYLSVELVDASGRISGSLWEAPQPAYQAVEKGDVVKVKGTAISYKERLHLSIEKLRGVTSRDRVEAEQLVPASDTDLQTLVERLEKLVASVHEPFLKRLLDDVLQDPQLRTGLQHAPGGKLWHHNYLRGLLEHTVSVATLVDKIAAHYPAANRDLLVTAALLHDIGKVDSYRYDTLIEYTDAGRLLGHIVLGSQIVQRKIDSIDGFPMQLAMELQHLVLSHQGKLEQASPVVPMTLEGLILYYADELDSKTNAFQRVQRKEGKQAWSSYVKLLDQFFYFGSDSPADGD